MPLVLELHDKGYLNQKRVILNSQKFAVNTQEKTEKIQSHYISIRLFIHPEKNITQANLLLL